MKTKAISHAHLAKNHDFLLYVGTGTSVLYIPDVWKMIYLQIASKFDV